MDLLLSLLFMVDLTNIHLAASTASSCLSFRNHRGTLSCFKERKQSNGIIKFTKTFFLLIVRFLNTYIFVRLKILAEDDLQGFHLEIVHLVCFQTNCSVRHQLLSFYVKNVFSHLGAGSDKLYITSAFQVLQANMNACVSIFLRAKLTLSSWDVREGLLHSFSADREGIQTCGVCHITKDLISRRLPLWGWGSWIPLISFPNELVGSGQGAGWKHPCWWCHLVLLFQHQSCKETE